MSEKVINLNEHCESTSLITRQAARDLFDFIAHLKENSILLDCNHIEYATRSFFDEFNAAQKKFQLLGKKVQFINLKEQLAKLNEAVVKQATSSNDYHFSSVSNAKITAI